jgi:hypothetical protein
MTEIARFLEDLKCQRRKYGEMARAVEEQKALIAAADVDALTALVERKRALLGEIEALEKSLAPFRERWGRMRGGLDPEAVREVELVVAETKEILAALVRAEDEGRALMERQREQAAGELRQIMSRKKARGAYGA